MIVSHGSQAIVMVLDGNHRLVVMKLLYGDMIVKVMAVEVKLLVAVRYLMVSHGGMADGMLVMLVTVGW